MLYIPILKTRREEYSIVKEMQNCFSYKIVPMFEIISEKYRVQYLTDETTRKFLYIKKGKRNYKIKKEESPEDVITLQYISDLINGKTAFIDYFRFSIEKYGRNIDVRRAELAQHLSNDFDLYKGKVLSVSEYPNLIPVISIKKEFDIPDGQLCGFIDELQSSAGSIAIRITEAYIEEHIGLLKQKLRPADYFLFDIEEQNPETKFMEIEEIQEYDLKSAIILVNSPRKLSVRNGEYPEHDITDLINNSARIIASNNKFAGYGDYCGLRDQMPMRDGSNGTGAALALLYDFEENAFYSYSNHDTSLGSAGYLTLIPLIKADKRILDPFNDCPGYGKVEKLESSGNWSTWHHINAVRYIYQTYKNI